MWKCAFVKLLRNKRLLALFLYCEKMKALLMNKIAKSVAIPQVKKIFLHMILCLDAFYSFILLECLLRA